MKHAERSGQLLSYCGVGVHHQNGIAEKRVQDIQQMARTMMLHAESQWPAAISTVLWSYAIRLAMDIINNLPSVNDPEHITPVESFSNSSVAPC